MNPRQPINESVQQVIHQERWNRPRYSRLAITEHLVKLFETSLSEEDQGDREKILALIKADKWDTNAQSFFDSISSSEHALALTPYTVSDYEGMSTYKVPGYNIGFAIKDHDGSGEGGSGHNGRVEIVAVHNNSGVKGLGQDLLNAAKKHGGTVLDHFDGPLSNIYEKAGFKVYKTDKYNPDYDTGGAFKKRYGEKDVHYRRLNQD